MVLQVRGSFPAIDLVEQGGDDGLSWRLGAGRGGF
jgi:hypothetical protein